MSVTLSPRLRPNCCSCRETLRPVYSNATQLHSTSATLLASCPCRVSNMTYCVESTLKPGQCSPTRCAIMSLNFEQNRRLLHSAVQNPDHRPKKCRVTSPNECGWLNRAVVLLCSAVCAALNCFVCFSSTSSLISRVTRDRVSAQTILCFVIPE